MKRTSNTCPFERNVRMALLIAGMKQKELGRLTGMKTSAILSYNNPTWTTVVVFAEALGTTPQVLLAEPDDAR